jgi:hypothetical protein
MYSTIERKQSYCYINLESKAQIDPFDTIINKADFRPTTVTSSIHNIMF